MSWKIINGALLSVLLTSVASSSAASSEQAFQALQNQEWERAESLYSTVIEENPWHAANFYNRGYARMKLSRCEAADDDFRQAQFIGGVAKSTLYFRARCAALGGHGETAIALLEELAGAGFDDFDRVLSDPGFESVLAHESVQFLTKQLDLSGLDRVAGWNGDIRKFDRIIRERHANPFHSVDESVWQDSVESLLNSVAQRTDLEVMGGLMRLAALVGDGHTVIYPPHEGRLALTLIPIRPFWFGDELRIRSASPEYARLVGARIERIAGEPVTTIWQRVRSQVNADNEFTRLWLASYFLRIPELYTMSGLNTGSEGLKLGLTLRDGSAQTVILPSGPPLGNPLSRTLPDGWVDAGAAKLPLWLSKPETNYWFQDFPEHDLLYFQFNQIRNQGEETVAEFVTRLIEHIDRQETAHLVIDIRGNNGGNSMLNAPLIRHLAAHAIGQERGRLFVITGRRTFSAAQNLASDLDRETKAIFVGEPTGSKPNFYGEDHIFRLPWSGLSGSVSTLYWQGGRTFADDRIWIAPDLAAPLSFEAYRAGQDPAMKRILDYLQITGS